MEILAEGKGSHFDPEVFEAFHSTLPKILEIKQNLSERQSSSQETAMANEGPGTEVSRPESAIRALAEAVLST